MKIEMSLVVLLVQCALAADAALTNGPPESLWQTRRQTESWRTEHRLIDMHMHIGYKEAFQRQAVQIMNRAGIGIGVNLSGGATTRSDGMTSEFERNKALADRLFPHRFIHYMNLDFTGWDEPDFSEKAVKQIEEGYRLGAGGLKEFKRLGLYLYDKAGKLILVDDPKLDPVWKRCGELGMPVSIHVADPRAFWLPYKSSNERWKELKDHPRWWFGDPNKYPKREELLAALNRVIERHPETTFVCVHFANNAEDLDTVERWLDQYPNMMADLAARVPEIGRHNPDQVRRLFLKHQDRILFGTDFQVYDRIILGSSGAGAPPTDEEAGQFFAKHWRWLETRDRYFKHMTPIQGDWRIDAIGLPEAVLRKIYFQNARRLLVRSLPPPMAKAKRIAEDFALSGDLKHPSWQAASIVRMDDLLRDALARPEISTEIRALWSDQFLYLGYHCPYSELTYFSPANLKEERHGLWDRDVVEAFIGTNPRDLKSYYEFEVAPNGERLDLELGTPRFSLEWNSGFASAVKIDERKKIWTAEMRIPLRALQPLRPGDGTEWRINFYRHDRAHRAFLAWSPTGAGTAHRPEKFGVLQFVD